MNQLFMTNKLLCKSSNIYIKEDFLKNHSQKESILKGNSKLSNIKLNNTILEELNIIYQNFLLDNQVEKFIFQLNKIIIQIEHLNKKNNFINKVENNINKNITLKNPFYKNQDINEIIYKYNLNDIHKKVYLSLLTQGLYINFQYPSLGLICKSPFYSSQDITLSELFENGFNIFENYTKSIHLPIQSLNLGDTLIKILTNGSNENNILFLKNYVDQLKIHLSTKTISPENKNNNKYSKKEILNSKYIIPYYFKNNKIYKFKEKEIEKLVKQPKKYDKIILDLYKNVLLNLKKQNNIQSVNEKHQLYKVAYLMLYQFIQIFYDLHDIFFNEVNDYIISIKFSNNEILKNLNYKECFVYLNKLNESIIQMKNILLNNAYELFKPSKSTNLYGIEYKNNIYDVSDNIKFFGTHIKENYPIGFEKQTTTLCHYFSHFNSKNIYGQKLFIGVNYKNNEHLQDILYTFNIKLNKVKDTSDINLYIIHLLLNKLQNCIPIELLGFLSIKKNYLLAIQLSKEDKVYFYNYVLSYFKKYLKESTKYILYASKNNLNKKKAENMIIISKIYNLMSYYTFIIIEQCMTNIELKNELLNKMIKIKNIYLSKVI